MATFTGSSKNDTITTTTVSALVTADPTGALPTDESDLITGLLGNDRVSAGGGEDFIYGEEFATTGAIKYGADTLDGAAGGDAISGDSLALSAGARGGNDKINGGDDGDQLYGDAGQVENSMTGATGGNDTIDGGAGDDSIWGDGPSLVGGKGGNDKIKGGEGDDVIFGDGEFLTDGAVGGNDTIDGGAGVDVIIGSGGNDKMTGGADADTFVFGESSGKDQILDFDVEEGDTLNLAALVGEGTDLEALFSAGNADALDAGDVGVTVKGKNMTIDLGLMFDTGDTRVDTIVLKGVTSISTDSISLFG